jgi:hypothetical protein
LSLCSFCYANADPAAAKMKVNAEAAIVAELAKLVPGIVTAPHDVPVWDCRVPGGCSLKRPDMLFRFEDRYIQIEVDEAGHAGYNCVDEDTRLEVIAADVGTPGLVLRLNPDDPRCFAKRHLSNGEAALQVIPSAFHALMGQACDAIKLYMAHPPPPTTIVIRLPSTASSSSS